MLTRTWGTMPTREEFDALWDKAVWEEGDRTTFSFGNDPRVGTCALSRQELWDELQRAWRECDSGDQGGGEEAAERAGDWASTVLYSLGLEWV